MKKKLLVVVLAVALMAVMVFVSACGKSGGGDASGEATSGAGASSDSENAGDVAETSSDSGGDMIVSKEAGIALNMPKTYMDNMDKVYLYHSGGIGEDGLYIMDIYLYPATEEALMTMSEEDFEAAEKLSQNVLTLFRVTKDWDREKLDQWIEWVVDLDTSKVAEIDSDDNYTVYAYEEEIPEGLSDELKTIYEGINGEIQAAKNSIEYSEPVDPALANEGSVISFASKDLEGGDVSSQDLFSGNEYTMVNFWTSWCGPCIQELPELEKLNKEFQEKGCGIVGVLVDANSKTGLEDGKDIVADMGVTYPIVQGWDTLKQELTIQFYPTTMFVDSEGNVVGETVLGAEIEKYKEVLNSLLGE